MIRRILFLLFLLIGIYGCSTPGGLFHAEHFGYTELAGGELQLFYSNPEYSNSADPLVQHDIMQREIFGKKSGFPTVTGGIGLMQVWRF